MEVWKAVPSWEREYEVSTLGSVRSLSRVGVDGKRYRGRLLSAWLGKKGYALVNLSRGGKPICRSVHTIVAEAFLGPRPAGMEVCHNNGRRNDNRVVNLRYDTRSGNALDMRRHGTAPPGRRGEQNGMARLTETDVLYIRLGTVPDAVLARRYGVHPSSIWNARTGKTWRHV